jgi:DtxR family Mn-dependent transcriptional regulator
VKYAPYKGVRLTAAGNKIALEVLRHHRLIELYLTKMLDYSWDEVHEEADRLEHVISEEMEARMDEALGFPDRDPHGDPIPTRDGKVSADSLNCLWECSEGKQFSVARVSDRNPEVLRYLDRIGIYPGMRVRVVKRAPFNGPLSVRVKEETYDLSEELARQIWVCLA